jgi:hypothetical protein
MNTKVIPPSPTRLHGIMLNYIITYRDKCTFTPFCCSTGSWYSFTKGQCKILCLLVPFHFPPLYLLRSHPSVPYLAYLLLPSLLPSPARRSALPYLSFCRSQRCSWLSVSIQIHFLFFAAMPHYWAALRISVCIIIIIFAGLLPVLLLLLSLLHSSLYSFIIFSSLNLITRSDLIRPLQRRVYTEAFTFCFR